MRKIKKKKLSKDEINLIPLDKYQNENRTEKICSICYTKYGKEDLIRILKCKHFFHKECVDDWLLNYNSNCPCCKIDLN